MGQSHSKNHSSKSKNSSENSSNQKEDNTNLDSNQSAQSMNTGSNDSGVNSMATSDGAANETDDHSSSDNSSEGGLVAKAASMVDTQSMKKNLNIVKQKAQDLMHTGKERVSGTYNSLSDDVKLRGMMVNDSVKSRPYLFAAGALGLGFILGRVMSGKGKSDMDTVVSAFSKVNLGSLAGLVGLKLGADTQTSQNQDPTAGDNGQARKIG